MNKFDVETFAQTLKSAIKGQADQLEAAREFVSNTVEAFGCDEMIRALQAAVPKGADIGELIVHQSDEITLLYGRIPARFRSAIHDHTVCACIAQLKGDERNVIYQRNERGSLDVAETITLRAGEVLTLRKEAIHHIENPGEETAHALHIYGGNFKKVESDRSLWSHDKHEQESFSFPALIQKSIAAMKDSGNTDGLKALGNAMPKLKPMVDDAAQG